MRSWVRARPPLGPATTASDAVMETRRRGAAIARLSAGPATALGEASLLHLQIDARQRQAGAVLRGGNANLSQVDGW
jgi:hypothetical protein